MSKELHNLPEAVAAPLLLMLRNMQKRLNQYRQLFCCCMNTIIRHVLSTHCCSPDNGVSLVMVETTLQ